MKQLLNTLIFVIISFNLQGQKLRIKHEIEYFDFKKAVISKDYYYYIDNTKRVYHGEFKSFYRNGQVEQVVNYDKGEVNGKLLGFYESGQKLIEEEYSNGIQVGEVNKYYENGKLMLNAIVENKVLSIKKYGFPDGSYAIKEFVTDSTYHFNIYKSNGTLLCKALNGFKSEIDTFRFDCNPNLYFKYPQILIEFQQEGLVILNIIIDKNGKLIDVKPMIGFNEQAVNETVNSIKKGKCFPVKLKDGEAIQYDINVAYVYKMI